MQLEFGGREAGLGYVGFADQFALLVHAQTVHSAVAVFECSTESRGGIGVTGGMPDHQTPQQPGVISLEDMQAVRAPVCKFNQQPAGFNAEVGGLRIGVPGLIGITHAVDR